MRIQDTYHFVLPSQFNPLPLMDSGQKVRLGVTKCGGGLEQVGPFPKLILRDHLVVSVIEQHLALLPTAQLLGDSGGKDSTVSGLASRIDDLMQAKRFGFPLALFRVLCSQATGCRKSAQRGVKATELLNELDNLKPKELFESFPLL